MLSRRATLLGARDTRRTSFVAPDKGHVPEVARSPRLLIDIKDAGITFDGKGGQVVALD